jgi:acylphosphatase
MIRRRVVARGQVQGVFFRDTTRRRAESLGIGGWVRNCPDGSVEAVFEGDSEQVESMVRFAREGPGGAAVEDLEVTEEEPEGIGSFSIR